MEQKIKQGSIVCELRAKKERRVSEKKNMGWVWKDEEEDEKPSNRWGVSGYVEKENPNSSDRCLTRKVIRSKCRTEEVEPGKFVRKCEKTEEVLRDCIGRPVEVMKSNTEYTEDDVTKEMAKGAFSSDATVSSDLSIEPFNFPGLRSDVESIERSVFGNLDSLERSVFGSLDRFFETAEEMKNGFFQIFGAPDRIDNGSSSSKREIEIEGRDEKEARGNDNDYSDFSSKIREV